MSKTGAVSISHNETLKQREFIGHTATQKAKEQPNVSIAINFKFKALQKVIF